jgi:hypothetical protein
LILAIGFGCNLGKLVSFGLAGVGKEKMVLVGWSGAKLRQQLVEQASRAVGWRTKRKEKGTGLGREEKGKEARSTEELGSKDCWCISKVFQFCFEF